MSYKRRKKQETESPDKKKNFKEKVSEALELPKELILNVPKITMVGNENLLVENYKGIIEYEEVRIRLNTTKGIVRITGNKLNIKEITSEDIMVKGEITSVEFFY